MRGSSISRPPISDSLVFIHAGGLHGVADDLELRVERLRLAQQRQDLRRSCAIEKCAQA